MYSLLNFCDSTGSVQLFAETFDFEEEKLGTLLQGKLALINSSNVPHL